MVIGGSVKGTGGEVSSRRSYFNALHENHRPGLTGQ